MFAPTSERNHWKCLTCLEIRSIIMKEKKKGKLEHLKKQRHCEKHDSMRVHASWFKTFKVNCLTSWCWHLNYANVTWRQHLRCFSMFRPHLVIPRIASHCMLHIENNPQDIPLCRIIQICLKKLPREMLNTSGISQIGVLRFSAMC